MGDVEARDIATTVEAARRGDAAAFTALVEAHRAGVRAVAYAHTGDASLSDEIVQETFVVAWHRLAAIGDPSRIGGWLRGVARRLARRRSKRRAHEPLADVVDDRVGDPIAKLEARELLTRTLMRMPAAYREPLVLFHATGESIRRIAEILGITVDAAEQRLRRGRAALAKEVERLLGDELSERGGRRSSKEIAGVAMVMPLGEIDGGNGWWSGAGVMAMASGKKILGAAALALVVGAAVVTIDATSVAPTDPEGAVVSAPHKPWRRSESSTAEVQRAREREADAPQAPAQPGRQPVISSLRDLEVSQLGVRTTINLAGGGSQIAAFRSEDGSSVELRTDDPADLARAHAKFPLRRSRSLRGRVLDVGGNAVPGAFVVAGGVRFDLADAQEPHVVADAATRADQDGAFELAVAELTDVVAFTDACMSAPSALAPGRTVTLTVSCATSLSGRIVRGKDGFAGRIELFAPQRTDTAFITLETDGDGRFEVRPAPFGALLADVSATSAGDDILGRPMRRELAVIEGEANEVELALDPGLTLLLSADLRAAPTGFAMVTHVLADGHHAFATAEQIEALAVRVGEQAVRMRSFGGAAPQADLGRTTQFDDLAAGPYTACVSLDDGAPVCRTVELSPEREVEPVAIEL